MSIETPKSDPPETPLDLEQLAAYLDGNLAAAERAALEERLGEDEDALELFAEAVRLGEPSAVPETAEAAKGAGGAGRSAASILPWLAVAASVLVTVALALFLVARDARQLESRELIAALPEGEELATRLGEDWTVQTWSELRGVERVESSPYPPAATAFRIGARTVDLSAALRAGDREAARFLAVQLDGLLPQEAVAAALSIADVREMLESGESMEALEPWLAALDRTDGLEHPDAYELGRWAEAARLATVAGDARFFGTRAWSRGLERYRQAAGDDELRTIADRLRSAGERGGTGPSSLATIRTDLERVIELLGNGDAELARDPS